MKQGKVFDKLIARKNVKGIAFNSDHCVVSLTNGSTKKCRTAHEARLFIEGKDAGVTAPKAAAFVAPVTTPQIAAPSTVAACGTEATDERTVLVTRDWLIEQTGQDFGVTGPHARVTIGAMAAIIAGGAAMAAGF